MKKLTTLLLLISIPFIIFSQQEEGQLSGRFTIYDSQSYQPVYINSDGGWTDIGQVYSQEIKNLLPPAPGTLRKWRLKTTYIDESTQGQSTLQIKLRQSSQKSPVFTLPWTEQGSRWQEKNSNWYIPYTKNGSLIDNNATLSVRLIAPPRSSSPGKVYRIELEAWDFTEESAGEAGETPELRMAFSSPAALMSPDPVRNRESRDTTGNDREQALEFSLEFVRFNIEGNLPGFYKSLDDQIHILNTGLSQSRYRVAPPASDLTSYSLADYKNSYRYHLYSYDEYSALFPGWTDSEKNWTPDKNCYLFLGTELKFGREDFMQGQNLVFMVEFVDGEWKITGIPE